MKVAVIGTGWWGRNIVKTLNDLEIVEKIYIYDNNKVNYDQLSELSKVELVHSSKAIGSDASIISVCIATHPITHYSLTKKYLLLNKNVFVEKPPALTINELDELGGIANKRNLVYMLDSLYMFGGPIQKLYSMISANEIKGIKFVQICRIGDELRRSCSGISRINNVMYLNNVDVVDDLMFHDLGILLLLFPDLKLKRIKKYFIYHKTICDSVYLEFSHSETQIELTLSWVFTTRKRGISIYTGKEIIEYDGITEENQLTRYIINESKIENITHSKKAPLTSILEYFLNKCDTKEPYDYGFNFMRKIFLIWKEVKEFDSV